MENMQLVVLGVGGLAVLLLLGGVFVSVRAGRTERVEERLTRYTTEQVRLSR